VIKISHKFDHGSLGNIEEIEPSYFRGNTAHWIKWDSIGDQYYWFYFRADGVQGQKVTFELENLKGVYRGNPHLIYSEVTQPVFSYDQETWERIEVVSYDSLTQLLTFSHPFDREPVWVAYAHPYSYKRYVELVATLKDQEFVTIESLSKTGEGRAIQLITITDPGIQDINKKTIVIMAMQHAGEDAGGFLIEGLIAYLLSNDPAAQKARETMIYKVLPMMNPDGIYHGISRYNAQREDLNNIWINSDRNQPEVTGVKNWVEKWYEAGSHIDLFVDVHNHTQFNQYNVFIFQDHSLDSLVPCIQNYWPTRIWHSTFKGSSCAWFFQKGIPSSTIELTQSRVEGGAYLTIEDYQSYGKGTVQGIADYFDQQ
jgi:hypothetical protein